MDFPMYVRLEFQEPEAPTKKLKFNNLSEALEFLKFSYYTGITYQGTRYLDVDHYFDADAKEIVVHLKERSLVKKEVREELENNLLPKLGGFPSGGFNPSGSDGSALN